MSSLARLQRKMLEKAARDAHTHRVHFDPPPEVEPISTPSLISSPSRSPDLPSPPVTNLSGSVPLPPNAAQVTPSPARLVIPASVSVPLPQLQQHHASNISEFARDDLVSGGEEEGERDNEGDEEELEFHSGIKDEGVEGALLESTTFSSGPVGSRPLGTTPKRITDGGVTEGLELDSAIEQYVHSRIIVPPSISRLGPIDPNLTPLDALELGLQTRKRIKLHSTPHTIQHSSSTLPSSPSLLPNGNDRGVASATAASRSSASSSTSSSSPPLPSLSFRVVMHVDMDCFYAAVEQERFPHFRGFPIAVVQNGTLAVTTNYRARGRGLAKTGPPEPMREQCAEMRFVGSDMRRYRAGSRAWLRVIQQVDPLLVVMKRSIDECYIDLTAAVRARIASGQALKQFRPMRDVASERARQQRRFDAATAAWQAEEQELQKRMGPLDSSLLESSGTLEAAVRVSKSTDPITQLREQQNKLMQQKQHRSAATTAAPTNSKSGGGDRAAPLSEALKKIIAPVSSSGAVGGGIAAGNGSGTSIDFDALHPIDFCRAQKAQKVPAELVPLDNNNRSAVDACAEPGFALTPFVGHLFLAGSASKSTPPSISEAPSDEEKCSSPVACDSCSSSVCVCVPPVLDFADEDPLHPSDDFVMSIGSQLMFEIRWAVFRDLGYTTSAAIAPNMMLAKVASSLHKPNQQSVVRPIVAARFFAPIRLKTISGLGPKSLARIEQVAEQLQIPMSVVGDLQRVSYAQLVERFRGDAAFARWLFEIACGHDDTPVEATGPPHSIGQSKRQRTFNREQKKSLLHWLATHLYERIVEDEHEYDRWPTTFVLSYIGTSSWSALSRRIPMPKLKPQSNTVTWMYEHGCRLLEEKVPENQALRCLSLTVTNFKPNSKTKDLHTYFTDSASAPNIVPNASTDNDTLSNNKAGKSSRLKGKNRNSILAFTSASTAPFLSPPASTSSSPPLPTNSSTTNNSNNNSSSSSSRGSDPHGISIPASFANDAEQKNDISAPLFSSSSSSSFPSSPPPLEHCDSMGHQIDLTQQIEDVASSLPLVPPPDSRSQPKSTSKSHKHPSDSAISASSAAFASSSSSLSSSLAQRSQFQADDSRADEVAEWFGIGSTSFTSDPDRAPSTSPLSTFASPSLPSNSPKPSTMKQEERQQRPPAATKTCATEPDAETALPSSSSSIASVFGSGSTLPEGHSPDSNSSPGSVCSRCGALLPTTAAAAEHEDFHIAREIQEAWRREDRTLREQQQQQQQPHRASQQRQGQPAARKRKQGERGPNLFQFWTKPQPDKPHR